LREELRKLVLLKREEESLVDLLNLRKRGSCSTLQGSSGPRVV